MGRWFSVMWVRKLLLTPMKIRTYGSISPGLGKWSKCGIFLLLLELCCYITVCFFNLFSTVLKKFCPLDSKKIFVFALAHLEPELELFEVWQIMVPQIIITNDEQRSAS